MKFERTNLNAAQKDPVSKKQEKFLILYFIMVQSNVMINVSSPVSGALFCSLDEVLVSCKFLMFVGI